MGLDTLWDTCLVELDIKYTVRVHDLLILMGRNMTQQKSLPISIWCGTSREVSVLLVQSLHVSDSILNNRE